MARKKSITISRKPRAPSSAVTTEVLRPQEPIPEDTIRVHVASATTATTEELMKKPGRRGKKSASFGFFGQALYGAAYGISFGVVLGAQVIGMLVPGKNIIGQAMTDATDSARRTFMGLTRRLEMPTRKQRKATEGRHEPSGIAEPGELIA